jgi:hypothetical protein
MLKSLALIKRFYTDVSSLASVIINMEVITEHKMVKPPPFSASNLLRTNARA